jgi:hypothetical protein
MAAIRVRERVVEVSNIGACRVVLYRQRTWHELLCVRRLCWDTSKQGRVVVGSDGSLKGFAEDMANHADILTHALTPRLSELWVDTVRFRPEPGDVVLLASPGVFGHTDEYLWWPSRVLRVGGTLAQKAEAIVAQTAQLAPTKDRAVVLVGF